MSKDPNTLSVNVSDSVAAGDVMGGGGPKDPVARKTENEMEYIKRYVPPHNKPSRPVEEKDIPHVLKEAEVLAKLCHMPRGYAGGAAAIAHMQIEDKDPMRFFVMKDGFLIVNPEIINHTKSYVDSKEGCMSFPGEPNGIFDRFNRVTVTFQAIVRDKEDSEKLILSEKRTEDISGHLGKVFQHECGHINGCNIYDEDYSPEKSVGIILPDDAVKDTEA